MKKFAILLAGLSLSAAAVAQDYTFSNNNVVPFSLNPALAGNSNAIRFALDYRMQWPALDNKFNTVRLSYDQNFYKQMSSVGVSFTRDNQADVFKNNEIGVIYSHNIRIQDMHFVRLGVQVALNINSLDGDLTMDDSYTGINRPLLPSQDVVENESVTFADFSFGAAYVWNNRLTVGAAVYHIGQPDNGYVDKEASSLGRKYVFHVNYLHDLESRSGLWGRRDLSSTYLFGSLHYQQQNAVVEGGDEYTYRQGSINLGAMTNPVLFGAGYKFDLSENYGRLNTLSVMVGANYKGLQAYYIFDLYTSKLDNGSWSHELSLVYVIPPKHYRYDCPVIYW